MPATGTVCFGPPYCGYVTDTNVCGAANCYCQKGTWSCSPTCAIPTITCPASEPHSGELCSGSPEVPCNYADPTTPCPGIRCTCEATGWSCAPSCTLPEASVPEAGVAETGATESGPDSAADAGGD
ncbi:MAG: hypothetical protein ACRELB_16805 [Polyangiaceae bacterium]